MDQAGKTVHVKVSFKKDNTGLGHKTHQKNTKAGDDGLAEFAQGLDVFQRILGRLNGKDENRVDAALGSRRLNMVMEMGKFGMAFVYGGLLEGTVDKMLVEDRVAKGKRKLEETTVPESISSGESSEEEEPVKKKSRRSDKKDKSEKKEKKDRKEKKEKKEKKDKKVKKSKSDKKDKKSKSDKSDKKDKKSKPDASIQSEESSKPKAQPVLRGMQGTRARWIAQKRAATMDAKSLAEILMVTS